MIAQLKGIIEEIDAGRALVDVNGVGYAVLASSRTLGALAVGEAAKLAIETVVREDAITLYGFASTGEQALFRLLTTVQGVGARVALALLSAFAPNDLVQAIVLGDAKTLSRAEGVGPKLAARIAAELKDKAAAHSTGFMNAAPVAGAPITVLPSALSTAASDAVAALSNLGYRRADVVPVVAQLTAADAGLPVDALIRAALKALTTGTAA